jgi:hypothetical protein
VQLAHPVGSLIDGKVEGLVTSVVLAAMGST